MHIEHGKLLFLRDHVVLMILLCPLDDIPVLGLVSVGLMLHRRELVGAGSI